MNVVRVKPGVEFTVIAPGGFRMLAAFDDCCQKVGVDLWITSACDGVHSGPTDPHKRGEAYDLRSHGFTEDQKDDILTTVMGYLGWDDFYGFLEAPGTENEHFHFQVKKGRTFP
jgi:hypothetical protein